VRFALESRETVGVRRQRRWQELQRDVASEPAVVGAIDLTHAAGAEQLEDLARPNASAAGQRHEGGATNGVPTRGL
jgi:hypothetical protein